MGLQASSDITGARLLMLWVKKASPFRAVRTKTDSAGCIGFWGVAMLNGDGLDDIIVGAFGQMMMEASMLGQFM